MLNFSFDFKLGMMIPDTVRYNVEIAAIINKTESVCLFKTCKVLFPDTKKLHEIIDLLQSFLK